MSLSEHPHRPRRVRGTRDRARDGWNPGRSDSITSRGNLLSVNDRHDGGFAPPGDIQRVHNTGDATAISIHIDGSDIARSGFGVRRYYDFERQNLC